MAEKLHTYVPVIAALGVVALAPAALTLRAPAAGAPALVIAAPWADAEAVAQAAGGSVIALTRAPMATLAVFPDDSSVAAAHAAGAWLVADGAAVAALCGVNR